MNIKEALDLADHYGGDQLFGDERDEMSDALAYLANAYRALAIEFVAVLKTKPSPTKDRDGEGTP